MNIEDYLATVPWEIKETINDKSGLCFRYSVSREKWLVAYGVARSKHPNLKKIETRVGLGDTALEAFEDLVVKIKKHNEMKI